MRRLDGPIEGDVRHRPHGWNATSFHPSANFILAMFILESEVQLKFQRSRSAIRGEIMNSIYRSILRARCWSARPYRASRWSVLTTFAQRSSLFRVPTAQTAQNGINPGDSGSPGDDGEPVTASAGSVHPTFPLNKATATGGNGGAGGSAESRHRQRW